MNRLTRAPRTLAVLAATAGLATSASATWSIVLINTRTGEIAVGSATCLTSFDLQAGTPVLIPGVGAATAQSFVDQGGFNRTFLRDRLMEGVHPGDILDMLAGFDTGHQTRQYGIADTLGGTATFTGTGAGSWAGGSTGQVGDIVYAVQGNVLAGDPVVFETEQVIVSSLTAGADLGETMMLAMEEARSWGGDGRCSCANGGPDSCGSPPDGWDPETGKSAHIAYMLIARAGDGFGCNSIYRVGVNAWGLATGDFDEDGLLDVTIAAQTDGKIAFLKNSDLLPGFVTFAPAQHTSVGGKPSGIDAADFDGDGHLDLVIADLGANAVLTLPGNGDGSFGAAAFDLVSDQPTWVVAGDFNNDSWPDAAVSRVGAGLVTILQNNGAGDLVEVQQVGAGVEPWVIITAEIDGNAGLDLACVDRAGNQLTILTNDGAGTMSLWQQLPTLANPLGVTAGDFDGDGRTDLATGDRQANRISVFRQTTPGVFTVGTVGAATGYTALETADINGDGLDDIVATNATPGRLTLLLGVPGADPEPEGVYPTGTQTNDIVVADFNGDGLPDVVHNLRATRGLAAAQGVQPVGGHGYFNATEGCATADYYMEFNVAFQSSGAPDPVDQLHDLYDLWRTDLLGVADAVRSTAVLASDRLPAGASTTLTIEPFDWQPAPLGPGLDISVGHAPDSAGLMIPGEVVDLGDGTYSVAIRGDHLPDQTRGVDRFEVRIRQNGREVILMPSPQVTLTGPIADWNGDGVVNTADLLAFLGDWSAGDPAVDLNNDGAIDTRDAVIFLRAWAGQ